MPKIIDYDFEDKELMLSVLDEVRDSIKSGDITSIAFTCLVKGGGVDFRKVTWFGQKTSLVGALETHKVAILSEMLSAKISSELEKI